MSQDTELGACDFNEKQPLEDTAHALRSLEGSISLENRTAGSDSTGTSELSGHTEHEDARSHLGSSHIGPKLDRAPLVWAIAHSAA